MATEQGSPEWAKDSPRKKLDSPYSFTELVSLVKNLIRPSKKFKNLTDFIPQKHVLNSITPKMRLGFIGDIMRNEDKDVHFTPELIEFFRDTDYLIGNFEGTITEKKPKVLFAQTFSEKILTALKTLYSPERFVLGNANNHSGDFGWTAFNKSYQMLKDYGFLTIGRRDEPSILLNNQINIVSCTHWTNQSRTPYIIYLDEASDYFNSNAKFNLLYPHWGYELQFYPKPKWIALAKDLLQTWDMIVGHHSHCPQPITTYEMDSINRLVAYSLGDFTIAIKYKKYQHGMVVKVELGPGESGQWQVGEVEWKFTRVNTIDEEDIKVSLEDSCKYFKDKL